MRIRRIQKFTKSRFFLQRTKRNFNETKLTNYIRQNNYPFLGDLSEVLANINKKTKLFLNKIQLEILIVIYQPELGVETMTQEKYKSQINRIKKQNSSEKKPIIVKLERN